jgi:hypothetical protein
VFQTWEYLRTWNAHVGALDQPYTIVALRGGRPVSVVPMLVTLQWRGGKHRPQLSSIGEGSTGHVVPLLHCAEGADATEAIARYVSAQSDLWDGIRMDAVENDSFVDLMRTGLQKRGRTVSVETAALRYGLDVSGSWQDFFSGRASSAKQAFEQAEARLKRHGEVRFDLLPAARTADAIECYLELESNAPDDEIGRGASASARHTSFHRALATRFAETLGMRIGFLHAGDQLAAGLIGFQWRGRFFLVHTTRSLTGEPQGASIALLGRFLQLCFEQRLCDAIEISAAGCPDAPDWSTCVGSSIVLQAQAASVLRRLLRRSEPFA